LTSLTPKGGQVLRQFVKDSKVHPIQTGEKGGGRTTNNGFRKRELILSYDGERVQGKPILPGSEAEIRRGEWGLLKKGKTKIRKLSREKLESALPTRSILHLTRYSANPKQQGISRI